MHDEREARLDFCQEQLLPIWETWTDGNPALRRFLECRSADPASHEERLQILVRASGELRRRGRGSRGVEAAALVAAAALKAYVGVPEGRWQEAVERALAAGRDAGTCPVGTSSPVEGAG
jgi:hypothetical protein